MLYVEFRCHIVCVTLTRVGGNAAVGARSMLCVVAVRNSNRLTPIYTALTSRLQYCWAQICRFGVKINTASYAIQGFAR